MYRRDREFRLGTKGQKREEDANPPLLTVYARRAMIRGRRGRLLEGMTAARLEPYHVESTEWRWMPTRHPKKPTEGLSAISRIPHSLKRERQ